jgi:uncharacterized protein (DUF2062 family)
MPKSKIFQKSKILEWWDDMAMGDSLCSFVLGAFMGGVKVVMTRYAIWRER